MMSGGIDQILQSKVDAYRSNPEQLAQAYQQNPQLMDLLALQKLKSEKEAAKRDMMLQEGQEGAPQTIAEQREGEVLALTKDELARNVGGVAMQQQAEMAQRLQELIGGGIATQPAPNMAGMAGGGIVSFAAGGAVDEEEEGVFERAIREEGITDPEFIALLYANYSAESSSGTDLRDSPAGAIGHMQVKPIAFREVADDGWDIRNPLHNIRAGIRYLKAGWDRYGTPEGAVAYYYAGPGNSRDFLAGTRDPRPVEGGPTTSEHIAKVMERYEPPAKPESAIPRGWDRDRPAPLHSGIGSIIPPDVVQRVTDAGRNITEGGMEQIRRIPEITRTAGEGIGRLLGYTKDAGFDVADQLGHQAVPYAARTREAASNIASGAVDTFGAAAEGIGDAARRQGSDVLEALNRPGEPEPPVDPRNLGRDRPTMPDEAISRFPRGPGASGIASILRAPGGMPQSLGSLAQQYGTDEPVTYAPGWMQTMGGRDLLDWTGSSREPDPRSYMEQAGGQARDIVDAIQGAGRTMRQGAGMVGEWAGGLGTEFMQGYDPTRAASTPEPPPTEIAYEGLDTPDMAEPPPAEEPPMSWDRIFESMQGGDTATGGVVGVAASDPQFDEMYKRYMSLAGPKEAQLKERREMYDRMVAEQKKRESRDVLDRLSAGLISYGSGKGLAGLGRTHIGMREEHDARNRGVWDNLSEELDAVHGMDIESRSRAVAAAIESMDISNRGADRVTQILFGEIGRAEDRIARIKENIIEKYEMPLRTAKTNYERETNRTKKERLKLAYDALQRDIAMEIAEATGRYQSFADGMRHYLMQLSNINIPMPDDAYTLDDLADVVPVT